MNHDELQLRHQIAELVGQYADRHLAPSAFVPGSSDYVGMDRMGILTGSILAALIGYGVTLFFSRKQPLA